MFRAHVLIIRMSKLHYTASGIITPIGGCLVQKLLWNKFYASIWLNTEMHSQQNVKKCILGQKTISGNALFGR